MTDLMSDSRHEELVKAAEECIDLMNIGAEPNAALRQVKKAFDMNDNEVVLVSHAINNSKQLAHLQNAKDKGAPFPLTNAESLTGANTKADLDQPGDNAEVKEKQPDAVEIAEKVKKEAAADSYESKLDFRKVAFDTKEAVAQLTEAWGVPKPLMEETDLSNPFDAVNNLKIAAEMARTGASKLRDEACGGLDKVAEALVTAGGPDFATFEKAANAAGITSELIDLIYDLGPASIEAKRCQEKVAGDRLYVSAEVMELVKIAQKADEQWQASADYTAVKLHLEEQITAHDQKIAAEGGEGGVWGKLPGVAEQLLPLDPESTTELGPMDPVESVDDPEKMISYKTKQQLQNTRARTQIESLMQDDFIGKHDVPEVVSSYNRALSVNPRFGDAEVNAFVRQDLASKNAMPMDLLIRASNAHQKAAPAGTA